MNVIDDAALLKLAEAEILGEIKRANVRHSMSGPSGWQPVPKTNKSFLVNTLLQTISSNKILSRKHSNSKTRERKLLQKDRKNLLNDNFTYQKPQRQRNVKKKNDKEKVKYDSEKIKMTKQDKSVRKISVKK